MKYIIYLLFTCLTISTEYRMDFPYSYQFKQVGGRPVNKAERNQARQLYKKLHNAVKKYRIKQEVVDSFENYNNTDLNEVKDLKREFLKKYSRKKYSSGSSSRSNTDFREKFKNTVWLAKQFEALNKTMPTGDFVNMVAAEPEGVMCGDVNQHDMPWGNCLLAIECESEFRIYRGDQACGRHEYVCCAIIQENYDLNMPFDLSFESSQFKKDTAEILNKVPAHKIWEKEAHKRHKARLARKKAIRRQIEKILHELKSMLSKAYHNSSKKKIKKTKQMKLFLLDLKNQAKKDRMGVRDIHTVEMIRVDARLRDALAKMKDLNLNFLGSTYDNVIVKIDGTDMMTKRSALMLQEYYPHLREYFPAFRTQDDEIGNLTYDIEFANKK